MKLIKERMNKKKENTTFVPTNMAVNFVQHNRCKLCTIILIVFEFPLKSNIYCLNCVFIESLCKK